MSRPYSDFPASDQHVPSPPIPPDRLAIVLADCRSGIHSPALLGALIRTTSPTALAALRDAWVAALVESGVTPLQAAAFVLRETMRVANLNDRANTLTTAQVAA